MVRGGDRPDYGDMGRHDDLFAADGAVRKREFLADTAYEIQCGMTQITLVLPFALPPPELAPDLVRALEAPALASLITRTSSFKSVPFEGPVRVLPHELWLARALSLDASDRPGTCRAGDARLRARSGRRLLVHRPPVAHRNRAQPHADGGRARARPGRTPFAHAVRRRQALLRRSRQDAAVRRRPHLVHARRRLDRPRHLDARCGRRHEPVRLAAARRQVDRIPQAAERSPDAVVPASRPIPNAKRAGLRAINAFWPWACASALETIPATAPLLAAGDATGWLSSIAQMREPALRRPARQRDGDAICRARQPSARPPSAPTGPAGWRR